MNLSGPPSAQASSSEGPTENQRLPLPVHPPQHLPLPAHLPQRVPPPGHPPRAPPGPRPSLRMLDTAGAPALQVPAFDFSAAAESRHGNRSVGQCAAWLRRTVESGDPACLLSGPA
eukprot:3821236-Pyramimonas_sp.AAC.1